MSFLVWNCFVFKVILYVLSWFCNWAALEVFFIAYIVLVLFFVCVHVHWQRDNIWSESWSEYEVSHPSQTALVACCQCCLMIGQQDSPVRSPMAPLCVAMEMEIDNFKLLSNSLFPLLCVCAACVCPFHRLPPSPPPPIYFPLEALSDSVFLCLCARFGISGLWSVFTCCRPAGAVFTPLPLPTTISSVAPMKISSM